MLEHGPILVPLDSSELAQKVLPYASALSEALRTHLVLITTWEGTDNSLGELLPQMAIEITESAQAYYTDYLDRVRAGLPRPDQVRVIVRPGEPAEEILAAADEVGARAIAIATHGRSGISRWIYGGTAGQIIRRAHRPVLVAGPHALERSSEHVAVKHIMVPLDGSAMSEAALDVAATIARPLNAKVSLVRAVNWAVQSYPYSLPDAYIPQIDKELEDGAKAYLRQREDRIRDRVSSVAAFVVRGAVADGLLEFVEREHVDLVVMTTHARSGIARAALGSTADRVLQGHAPVLLIPPDVAPAAA